MKSKLKRIVCSMAVLALGLGATACGKKEEAKKEEKVTVRIIQSLATAERDVVMKEILAKYEADHPNIKIELITPPYTGSDMKINQLLNAKADLDIIEVRDWSIQQLIQNGHIDSLEKYVGTWDGVNTLTPTAKTVMTKVEGKPYLVPIGLFTRSLFYRKDWFKEAGLNPPQTMEEMLEIGKKLTDPSKNRYGYAFRGVAAASMLEMFLISDLGEKDNLDSAYFLKDGNTIFSDPQLVTTLDNYKKFFTETAPKDSISWGFLETVNAFTSGTAAMIIQDPDVIPMASSTMKPEQWGTAPLPVGVSGKSYTNLGYNGWGIVSYSKNKDIAWDIIKYLSSANVNTEFCKKVGYVPVHETAAKDPFFADGPYAALMHMTAHPERFAYYFPSADYKGYSEFVAGGVADKKLQSFLLGEITSKDVLRTFDEFWVKEKANKEKK